MTAFVWILLSYMVCVVLCTQPTDDSSSSDSSDSTTTATPKTSVLPSPVNTNTKFPTNKPSNAPIQTNTIAPTNSESVQLIASTQYPSNTPITSNVPTTSNVPVTSPSPITTDIDIYGVYMTIVLTFTSTVSTNSSDDSIHNILNNITKTILFDYIDDYADCIRRKLVNIGQTQYSARIYIAIVVCDQQTEHDLYHRFDENFENDLMETDSKINIEYTNVDLEIQSEHDAMYENEKKSIQKNDVDNGKNDGFVMNWWMYCIMGVFVLVLVLIIIAVFIYQRRYCHCYCTTQELKNDRDDTKQIKKERQKPDSVIVANDSASEQIESDSGKPLILYEDCDDDDDIEDDSIEEMYVKYNTRGNPMFDNGIEREINDFKQESFEGIGNSSFNTITPIISNPSTAGMCTIGEKISGNDLFDIQDQ